MDEARNVDGIAWRTRGHDSGYDRLSTSGSNVLLDGNGGINVITDTGCTRSSGNRLFIMANRQRRSVHLKMVMPGAVLPGLMRASAKTVASVVRGL